MTDKPKKPDIKKGAEPPLRVEKPQQPPSEAPKSEPKPVSAPAPKKSK